MQHYPLVTVVGGSGFVGRHTVKLLAGAGYRVRVLVRDTIAAEFLKMTATVGSIAIEYADITRPETLIGKFTGSDAVINLVSIMQEGGRQKFEAINVKGAAAVATEAKRAGARAFVHVSALGVDRATNDSKYGKTKIAGEDAVRAAFPEATILQPSLVVGPEDCFFQRFARLSMIAPALPIIGGGKTLFQPVDVTDVARAILAAVAEPAFAGRTYELAGPQTYSLREMLEVLARITNRRPCLISLPSALASFSGFFFELSPLPAPITRDQVKMLKHDSIANAGAAGFADLGITPIAIEDVLPQYLSRFIKQ